jgi:hypothetical protein
MKSVSICVIASLLVLMSAGTALADELATVTGFVTDPHSLVVPHARVKLTRTETNVSYYGATNDKGFFSVPSLPPGIYRIEIQTTGFKTVVNDDIEVHVQEVVSLSFRLELGSVMETVAVEGGTPLVNTTDGSVSTVVDHNFIENMPLNGRSFQDLILLTPGVVTNTPQTGQTTGAQGEFSVNGQRTESNYYLVDGVSANLGISPGAVGAPGSVPSATALGTTQALVSVDALQEFRVQTSTYSAEYGRNPGGQFSFATRSGTDDWHGTAFDYLRNSLFDANDWFNDYFGQPEPAERQNDFGGTLGAPVRMPGLYDGKDKTFFFVSYEGLRLRQPQPSSISNVPTAGPTGLRTVAPGSLQPVLKAFPLPYCPASLSPESCSTDLGNGLGDFVGTWSNPSSIDAFSVRFDQAIGARFRLFFRFSNTSSDAVARSAIAASQINTTSFTTRTYTAGLTSAIANGFSNEFRLNYSSNEGTSSSRIDNIGGAQPVNLAQLQGLDTKTQPGYLVQITIPYGDVPASLIQLANTSRLNQWNLIDSTAIELGRHQLKFGVDYRRLALDVLNSNPYVSYGYYTENSIVANTSNYGQAISSGPAFPDYTNFAAFVQDTWTLTPRLSIDIGLRWEVNPPPGVTSGLLPYTVSGLNDLSTATLAPAGTPLWRTGWHNLAPRASAAYALRTQPGSETIVRGGAGIFYDTGQQTGSNGFQGPGYVASSTEFGAAFPYPGFAGPPAIANPPIPPYGTTIAFPPSLELPWTLQTNLSVQQALGKTQALTVSYVGAFGRKLLELNDISISTFNTNFGADLQLFQNGLSSDYNALQVQFQKRLSRGLQVLASYTTSHCIDYGSQNYAYPYERGNCDFDIRQNFSSAFSYDLPNSFRSRLARIVAHDWHLDDRLSVRSGFPVPLYGANIYDTVTQQYQSIGFNLVPNQPIYIYGAECAAVYANGLGCPGGRAINPNAFSLPAGCSPYYCPPGTTPGDAPRNFARGFGAWQMDLAVRRDFPIRERLKLQFRVEAFNLVNHPNFGTINPIYCVPGAGTGCDFGQAKATLANSLTTLSSLYQIGGPRSMQFALKLAF